jgi:hypothetical protein
VGTDHCDDGANDGVDEEVARRAEADPRIRYINRTGDKSGANVVATSASGRAAPSSSRSSTRTSFLSQVALFAASST